MLVRSIAQEIAISTVMSSYVKKACTYPREVQATESIPSLVCTMDNIHASACIIIIRGMHTIGHSTLTQRSVYMNSQQSMNYGNV